ncbi:MAG: DHCW motif cupin fold protein [Candidatus Acidiferrales bacterium]
MPASFTDWVTIPPDVRPGRLGNATVRAQQFGGVRLRLIQYSAAYAGNWCVKGHIVFVVAGEVVIEHQSGPTFSLKQGMSYHVTDQDGGGHRLSSQAGASLFIVD